MKNLIVYLIKYKITLFIYNISLQVLLDSNVLDNLLESRDLSLSFSRAEDIWASRIEINVPNEINGYKADFLAQRLKKKGSKVDRGSKVIKPNLNGGGIPHLDCMSVICLLYENYKNK